MLRQFRTVQRLMSDCKPTWLDIWVLSRMRHGGAARVFMMGVSNFPATVCEDTTPSRSWKRARIARLPVDVISPEDVAKLVVRAINHREKLRVHTLNVDHVVVAHLRPSFFSVVCSAQLVVADGMPIVWSLRRRYPEITRVTGTDTVTALFSHTSGFRFFLLGGKPGVATQVGNTMLAMGCTGQVVGVAAPDRATVIDDDKARDLIDHINACKPDILLVAFGAPLQEEWLVRHGGDIEAPVTMGVGAAFDFLSGRLKRAPEPFQRYGLEWAHRIAQDPLRLLKRYLLRDWLFLWYLLRYGIS